MLQEYNTYSYKEKNNRMYQKRIDALLSSMPEFCAAYELYMRQTTVIKTRFEYLQDLSIFFRFLVAKNPAITSTATITTEQLENLNGFDFDEYTAWLANYKFDKEDATEQVKKNSSVSRRRKVVSLKSFYHFLFVRSYIGSNPAERAIMPKVYKKKRADIRVLNDNECAAFLQAIDEEIERTTERLKEMQEQERKIPQRDAIAPYLAMRDKAIIYLFLGTGLRVSELCAIDRSDISPLGYINVIRKEDSDELKTTDTVYLSDEVQEILNWYIVKARDKIGAMMDNYDALFLSSKHERITPRGVELMVKKYADRSLGTNNGITPHKLRATFGTRYYAMTGDISATSTVMNHASIETTAAYYLKENADAKVWAADLKI